MHCHILECPTPSPPRHLNYGKEFAKAIEDAGLADMAASGEYTVLAPCNKAVAAHKAVYGGKLSEGVVKYHFIPKRKVLGQLTSDQETLQGDKLNVVLSIGGADGDTLALYIDDELQSRTVICSHMASRGRAKLKPGEGYSWAVALADPGQAVRVHLTGDPDFSGVRPVTSPH